MAKKFGHKVDQETYTRDDGPTYVSTWGRVYWNDENEVTGVNRMFLTQDPEEIEDLISHLEAMKENLIWLEGKESLSDAIRVARIDRRL